MLDSVGLLGFAQRTKALIWNPSLNDPTFQENKVKAVGDTIRSLALFVILAKFATTYAPFLYELRTIRVVDEIALGIYLLVQTFMISAVLAAVVSLLLFPKGLKLHSLIFYHNFRVKALINIPFFVLFSIMLGKMFDGSDTLDFELDDGRFPVALISSLLIAGITIKYIFLPIKEYFQKFYSPKISFIMTCICLFAASIANTYAGLGLSEKLINKEEACKAIFDMNKQKGNVPNSTDRSCFVGKCIELLGQKEARSQ